MTNSLCQVKLLNIFPSIPAVFSKATDQLKLSYKKIEKSSYLIKCRLPSFGAFILSTAPKEGNIACPDFS